TINIDGNVNVTATGGSGSAGIGSAKDASGGAAGNGSTTTISGGIVKASGVFTGIGGNGAGNINHFDSGNIYPMISDGTINIRDLATTTNGPSHGNRPVYCLKVMVKNEEGAVLPEAQIMISGLGSGNYTYSAETDENGEARIWLPLSLSAGAAYVLEAEHGNWGYGWEEYIMQGNNNQQLTITLGPITTLTANPYGMVFIENGSKPVTLHVKAQNKDQDPGKDIAGIEWFREKVDYSDYDKTGFDADFAAANPEDKGYKKGSLESFPSSILELPGGSSHQRDYQIAVDKNAAYRVKVGYIVIINGYPVLYSQVKTIVVENIYTHVGGVRKGIVSESIDPNDVLYIDDIPSGIIANAGVALDLDGSVLSSTDDGLTSWPGGGAVVSVPAKSDFSHPAIFGPLLTPKPAYINKAVLDPVIFEYEQLLSSGYLRVKFDLNINDYGVTATPGSVFNRYYTDTDKFYYHGYGDLPQVIRSDDLKLVGWTRKPDDPDTMVTYNDPVIVAGTVFDYQPSIKVMTLYAFWRPSAELSVQVPVKLIFAAFEGSSDEITRETPLVSREYRITNFSEVAVTVSLDSFSVIDNAGLNLTNTPAENPGDINLWLKPIIGKPAFSTGYLSENSVNVILGALDPDGSGSTVNSRYFGLDGTYVGDFDIAKWPKYSAVFKFTIR
ncbi:MAG: hypothetical protein FWD21_03950, partial [Peptococcaceae bacterium]|nr:hypothetical protein [Peptococcaceae bacterium]